MNVSPSTFASPVFLMCLLLFVVDETSKMLSLEFTCVHLKYLPDSASQAKITSWGFQALPLPIRLRTRSSAALEALVLVSLAEQQQWKHLCVIFPESDVSSRAVPGLALGMDAAVSKAVQGRSPCAGPKATGRISSRSCSCADLSVPGALPAPCSTTKLTPLWFSPVLDQSQPLWLCLPPACRVWGNRFCWCCGEGSRAQTQLCPGSGLSAFPQHSHQLSRKYCKLCHECYLIYWGEKMWILPGQ